MMKYLKYIFGVQLFLGSIWSFYYSIYWAGFLLLTLSSILLIPLIYKLLRKKLSGFKAGCLIFSVFFIGISWFGISYLMYLLAPVDTINTNIADKSKNNYISVYAFEQSLNDATQYCFSAYDYAFSKSIKYRDEQCNRVNEAQKSCISAQHEVDNIIIPDGYNTELISLLKDIKSDSKNSLQSWASFFGFYSDQCLSKSPAMSATDAKLQLVSAVKSMFLVNMKIKKAKSMS